MSDYTLYGAQISYFTGKVRAYLRWKGISFTEVTPTAEIYRDVILPRVGFPVIPVMVTPNGDVLQDSSAIIETLERAHAGPSIFPAGGTQRLVSALLELYGDEWLVIPAMHYRWHHNRDWAIRAFGEVSAPHATPDEQVAIGSRRAAPFAQAATALGAEPHMHTVIERSYEGLLGELDRHFAVTPYVFGTRPCIGDFGLFGPLYAHQYRDPASGALMRRVAPNVVAWVERMRDAPTPHGGEFIPDDEVPDTLLPVLRRMMREQLPELVDTARALRDWLAAHHREKIPRSIGTHSFEIGGVRGERYIGCYKLWMLQRALDVYRGLTASERERADRLIDAVDGQALRSFGALPRLERDGLSVALARDGM
jgi:glutathione S-transferase